MRVPFRFIITSLWFFYLAELLFCAFLQVEGNLHVTQKRLKYRDAAPLSIEKIGMEL